MYAAHAAMCMTRQKATLITVLTPEQLLKISPMIGAALFVALARMNLKKSKFNA